MHEFYRFSGIAAKGFADVESSTGSMGKSHSGLQSSTGPVGSGLRGAELSPLDFGLIAMDSGSGEFSY